MRWDKRQNSETRSLWRTQAHAGALAIAVAVAGLVAVAVAVAGLVAVAVVVTELVAVAVVVTGLGGCRRVCAADRCANPAIPGRGSGEAPPAGRGSLARRASRGRSPN